MQCNETGSYKGSCCCNCKFRCYVQGHPNNKHLTWKLNELISYGCSVRLIHKDADELPVVVALEQEHGMCELHTFKE